MRIVSADEAVSGIKSGQQILIHGAAATPSVLLDALVRRAPELADVKIVHMHCEGPHPHLGPGMEGHFLHRALFIGPNARAAINEGRAEFIPVFLSDIPRLIDSGLLPLDAVFANMTPPDEHGFCSLGTSVDTMLTAIRNATTVIAQFNKSMPRTLGDSFVHISKIDFGVEVDQPPYLHEPGHIGEIENRIGQYVAELVPDCATIQMGIGAIPTAVGLHLDGKKHLGVHTEMFTDPLVDLMDTGVVDCSRKELDCGKVGCRARVLRYPVRAAIGSLGDRPMPTDGIADGRANREMNGRNRLTGAGRLANPVDPAIGGLENYGVADVTTGAIADLRIAWKRERA